MKIAILDRAKGEIVYTTEVIVRGMNYQPSDVEAFNEAWRAAVEDGAVAAEEREKYVLQIIGAAAA